MGPGTSTSIPDSMPKEDVKLMLVRAVEPEEILVEEEKESMVEHREIDAPRVELGTSVKELHVSDERKATKGPQLTEEEEEKQFFTRGMAAPEILLASAERSKESTSESKNIQVDLPEASKGVVNSACASEDIEAIKKYYAIRWNKNLTDVELEMAQTLIKDRWTKQTKYWENREKLKNCNAEINQSGDIDYG